MKILFVCLGNICRSPLAEGIARAKADKAGLNSVYFDSCGFEPFHAGDPPDRRALEVARRNKIDISGHAARLFVTEDFDIFDHIYVMDRYNFRDVTRKARNGADSAKISYMMDLLYPGEHREVPDPWYGNMDDFSLVFRQLEQAIDKLILKL